MQPRYYQTASNDAAWRFMFETKQNPLIVLPTGAGKSVVIGLLVKQAVQYGQRVIVLAHRKELLEQNAAKIQAVAEVPVGIYSAGLGQRDYGSGVICAGIQSVYDRGEKFGPRGLIVVDEAHLISDNDDSMYRKFLASVAGQPQFVVGLTATPYRTGEGAIYGDDKLFGGVCYEAATGKLIGEGYLSELTNKAADNTVDTSSVSIRGGEFAANEMEAAFTDWSLVGAAAQEIVAACAGRRSVLLFAAGVSHAEQVRDAVQLLAGEAVGLVTGSTPADERDATLQAFRSGQLRWCVNVDVLTTGFDAPGIDALAVLRATMSPGLFAQMVGRGLRKADGKANCLVLDFGGNLSRHGSLDRRDYGIYSGAKGGKVDREGAGGEKVCPACRCACAARAAFCPECRAPFAGSDTPRHNDTADGKSAITGEPEPEMYVVKTVDCWIHQKRNQPEALPSMCVSYTCRPEYGDGNLIEETFREWICFEHDGFARQKAVGWWQNRSKLPVPVDVATAVLTSHSGGLRHAARIWVVPDGKYHRIKRVEFDDEMPENTQHSVTEYDPDEVPF